MKTPRPERISRYLIPAGVVATTQRYFRQVGQKGMEAIGYWTGTFAGNDARVVDVLFPSKFAKKRSGSWGHARVDLDTAFHVGQEIRKREQYLLIQLHTHPLEAFHSWIDDEYPISHRLGFVSIVIPRFAKYPMDDQSTWKVYEYLGAASWRQLDADEVGQRFIISRGDSC